LAIQPNRLDAWPGCGGLSSAREGP
jgi:hypothetical protein